MLLTLSKPNFAAQIPGIEAWFKANPTRKTCRTEYGTVRRGKVEADLKRLGDKTKPSLKITK